MKRIGTTAILLAALLAAAWALQGPTGPRPGSGIKEMCKKCCLKKYQPCPAICNLALCKAPAPGQCPFVDKTRIRCSRTARDTCRSDKSCPKGQRCCDTGCTRNCSPVCQPACGKGIKCIKSTIYCIRAPCPQPLPGCERAKPSNRGTCPVNDILPVILCLEGTKDRCSGDDQCPKRQKCCSYGCSRTCVPPCRRGCRPDQKCVLERPPSGPCLGSDCPPKVSKCVLKDPCSLRFCPSGFRCVVRNYESKCEKIPSPKLGTCPVNDILPVISCLVGTKDNCFGDDQCPKKQKCCSYGCSRNCVQPCLPACRPDQKCVLKRPPGPCLGSDCPLPASTCEPKDPCSVVDCKSGYRCVVRDGKAKCEPPPPRPGFCPANDIITTCEVRENACTSDTQCKRGQKCCSRGCGRECLPACRNCRPDQTCRITVFPCIYPPCPTGARCVTNKPVTKPGVCPRNDIISTCEVRKDACNSDAQCKRSQKCCSRGCGRACVSVCKKPCPPGQECKLTVAPCLIPPCPEFPGCHPVKPVVRPGTCPPYKYAGICVIGKTSCTSDKQCKRGQKCCRRGCGRKCVTAMYVKKY